MFKKFRNKSHFFIIRKMQLSLCVCVDSVFWLIKNVYKTGSTNVIHNISSSSFRLIYAIFCQQCPLRLWTESYFLCINGHKPYLRLKQILEIGGRTFKSLRARHV